MHRSQDPFRGVFFVATSKNVIDAMCGWVGSTAEGRGGSYVEAWLASALYRPLAKIFRGATRPGQSLHIAAI